MHEADTIVTLPLFGDITFREWHAFVNGFYVGFTAYKNRDHEYTREKHWWRGGFLVGWFVKAGLILLFGRRFVK
jgi:hypothetical protein